MTYEPYPKRDPIKNYFPLPNEVFALNLTPGELAVYSYLMRCEDRATHQCHPSYATIGRAVNLSKNTVRKHVQGLCEKHLITTEPTTVVTRGGEKRNGTLLYTLRPVEEPSAGTSGSRSETQRRKGRGGGHRRSWTRWRLSESPLRKRVREAVGRPACGLRKGERHSFPLGKPGACAPFVRAFFLFDFCTR